MTFHDAMPVMGKSTTETEAYMKEKFGRDVRTLSIGRAGEKAVAMASIFSETRTFGRGGAGAVLGSKRIKGMAFKGTKAVDVADRKAFQDLVARNVDILKAACADSHNLVGLFSRVGTGAGMGLVNSQGRHGHPQPRLRRLPRGKGDRRVGIREEVLHPGHLLLRLPRALRHAAQVPQARQHGVVAARARVRDHVLARLRGDEQGPRRPRRGEPALRRLRHGHAHRRRDHRVGPRDGREGDPERPRAEARLRRQ